MTQPSTGHRWSVVLPVKGRGGKSRLVSGLRTVSETSPDAGQVSLAMASDVLAAVLGCAQVAEVLAVSRDDDVLAHLAHDPRVRPVADARGRVVDPGEDGEEPALNAAVRRGLEAAMHAHAAVVVPDLVCLRPEDLDSVLGVPHGPHPWVVADRNGTGTCLLAGRRSTLRPRFGRGSLRRHTDDGAITMDDASPRLRLDVDTVADLAAAVRLGIGASTTALLGSSGVLELVRRRS